MLPPINPKFKPPDIPGYTFWTRDKIKTTELDLIKANQAALECFNNIPVEAWLVKPFLDGVAIYVAKEFEPNVKAAMQWINDQMLILRILNILQKP